MGVSTSGSSMAKKTTTVTSLEMLPSKNAAVYLVTNCLPPTQVMFFFLEKMILHDTSGVRVQSGDA